MVTEGKSMARGLRAWFLVVLLAIAGVTSVGVTAASAAEIQNAATDAPASFPVGYIIGIVLVLIGVAGGIYGQVLRRRGRRPPGS
ncbi:hypothetical protein [Glaciihabitans sp. UYNi722]|uniref:hypothetical protein n=1 Tax=Glaciihabitans sp. UYNi722 TaxID=3156344 RepID=UPI00339B4FAC